ncbi:MAG: hypothetical protein WDN46_15885 [Methylocella sp.]
MKPAVTGLRITSTVLYVLSIGAALRDLELSAVRGGPKPWLDYFWIGSGILSLFLAFCAEKMEQRIAVNGQDEQAVESKTALFARFIALPGKSSSDAASPHATPAE